MNQMSKKNLTLTPIGVLRCTKKVKFDAPHQPEDSDDDVSIIELEADHNFENALRDLAGFERIWLLWWFDKNTTWRPLVLPPRGGAKRRGVFATRSPHRPNPIGMTAVKLIKIEGRKIFVGNADLLDGTPILDIKPYITTIDSFPESRNGWIEEVDRELLKPPAFRLSVQDPATHQIAWLKKEWSIDFIEKAFELLSRDPTPHRTRRISKVHDGFRMGCGAWRIFFKVEDLDVLVQRIAPGYPEKLLHGEGYTEVPDRDAQTAFLERWR